MLTVHQLTTPFTIASGQTISNVISLNTLDLDSLVHAEGAVIYGPSALTGTVTVEVSPDNTNWFTLQSGGTDVSVGVSKALSLTELSFRHIRLKSSSAEGATRTFLVSKQVNS